MALGAAGGGLIVMALGTFVLHSFAEPPVKAGRHQLRGTQPGAGVEVAEHVAEVVVSAPRYVLPPDQVLSTFPPAMAEGDFGERLPQIVLKRRTLPWERDPGGPPRGATDPPRPWLALVVLADGEGSLSPEPVPVAQCVTPGRSLPHPEDADSPIGYHLTVTRTVVDRVFPTVEDLPLLVHVREVDVRDTELVGGDDDGWLAVVLANRLPIAVPGTAPAGSAPRSVPVTYLACLVNLEGQVDLLPTDQSLETVDVFEPLAAVQDVRAVFAAATSTDHAVMGTGVAALPGQGRTVLPQKTVATPPVTGTTWASAPPKAAGKVIPQDDAGVAVRKQMAAGFAFPFDRFVIEETCRFPVLAHWRFTATNDGDFRAAMQALDVGLIGTTAGTVFCIDPDDAAAGPVEHPNRPDPQAPPRPDPPKVAETGHVVLPQTTRRGEPATAWYRGPLVPLPTDRAPADTPLVHVSDELRAVTPDGREDVGLAAAFEIGRLLGLSQLTLVRALVAWRAEQFGATRAEQIAAAATATTPIGLGLGPLGRELGRRVGLDLLTLAGAAPVRLAGPGRPIADPGRPIGLSGPLDQVVATGLGLDLDRLRGQIAEHGLLAALAATPPMLAPTEGATGPAAVAGLRARLDAELGAVAAAAGRRRGPALIGVTAADSADDEGAERDALDNLIDKLAEEDR